MCWSGVGIGMRRRRIRQAALIWEEPIHAGRHLRRITTVCCAAAIGTSVAYFARCAYRADSLLDVNQPGIWVSLCEGALVFALLY